MATLYWGGGTGTWAGFTTGNWYTDLGRTVLSTRAPSAEDDVIFDATSNATAYTVTVGALAVCRNITVAGPASGNITLDGFDDIYIYGGLTFPATGLTLTYSGAIQFYGTGNHTITTNGIALVSSITFAGTGTYTLQDAFNNSGYAINVNAGTFNTNGQTLTAFSISTSSGATTAGILNLGASTVNITSFAPNGPLIVNGGTSNITLSSTGMGFSANFIGGTFYNVTYTSAGLSNFYGTNTFNNLTFATASTATVNSIVLYGNLTVNGTLTIAGQLSVRRFMIRSSVIGTSRTITANAVATLTDVDFRDIVVAGTSAPWSGTRLGDCGGNTNITFPAAKTVYWNSLTGGAWSGTFWAASSGGAVSADNFPLAQDTAIINDTGLNSGASITGFSSYNLKTLTSTKTNAFTLTGSQPFIYGDLTATASMTMSSFQPHFAGRVTQNLTSAANSLQVIYIGNYGVSLRLVDNLTVTTMVWNSGGLDTNSRSITFTSGITIGQTGLPFALTLGSSALTLASGGISSSSATPLIMTVSAGTSTITCNNASVSFGILGQNITWYNVICPTALTQAILFGTNTFNNLTYTAPSAGTGLILFRLYGNLTVTGTLAFGGGPSVLKRLNVVSDTPGIQRTITAATVTGLSDIDFRDIAAAGASAPWSGTRLGNCAGNSGITFATGVNKYWNLTGAQNWNATGWATTSGGTPAANNFPLAQDTAVFDNTGAATSVAFSVAYNVGSINASARTTALTISSTAGATIFGDVNISGSGITFTFNFTLTFSGSSTQTFTTGGKSLVCGIIVNNLSCIFQHGDALTTTSSINVTSGSYTTQNYNVSLQSLVSGGNLSRSITLGTSTLTCSYSAAFSGTNLTFSGLSSTIILAGAVTRSFDVTNVAFGTLSITGGTTANAITFSGNPSFKTISNASVYPYLIFTSGSTVTVNNFTYTGAVSNVVRMYTTIPGQRVYFKKGNSNAIGANTVNGGNNSNLAFTGTSQDYFYAKDIVYSLDNFIAMF